MANETTVVTPGDYNRRVQVELDRLVTLRLGIPAPEMLSESELDDLKSQAEKNVRRQLGGATLVSERDEVLAPIRAEFAAADADIDVTGALLHARAEVLLAAMRTPMTEENYLSALHALDSETARRTDATELDEHLAAAEALSDLAENRLWARGVRKDDARYDDLFVAEIGAISRESGLDYYAKGA
jgi:hypothetical protein